MFASRIQPNVWKRCNWKYFFGDFGNLFFFILVTGNHDESFRYCSRIYIWNWSLFYIIKIYCSNWQRTRFVSNERSIEASLLKMLLSNVVLENILEKNPPTYPPIGEMEGQVQEKTYFSGWSWIWLVYNWVENVSDIQEDKEYKVIGLT